MSKVSMPRPRYVAFRIAAATPASRKAVGQGVRDAALAAGIDGVQLTRFEWPHGIVRVPHGAEAAARRALEGPIRLEGKPARAHALSTSGTILALTERLGILGNRTE